MKTTILQKLVFTTIMLSCGLAFAATYTLSPPQSIQTTIDSALTGDVIVLSPGSYTGTINFNGKAVTVRSIDPGKWEVVEATIIDASGAGCAVTFASGESSAALLSGVTVRGGKAVEYDYEGGAGILFTSEAAPTIQNCLITENEGENGAGIHCNRGARPTLTGCRIASNNAADEGGGAYIKRSAPTFINCAFSDNQAFKTDGLAFDYNSSTTMTGCSITQHEGAGFHSYSNAMVSLTNCIITGNRPGLFCGDSSHLEVNHCTITRNRGSSIGSGLYFWGDGVRHITNSIIWNLGPEIYIDSGTTEITYSCIQGGWPGTGNISALPDFVNANDDDYHLLDGSPCIDRGDPSVGVSADYDGNSRPGSDGLVDMGAFESPAGFLPGSPIHEPQIIYVGISDATPTGESWSSAFPAITDALEVSNTSDEIWVRSGEYREIVDMEPVVQLYGGFAGTETSRSERNFSLNPTIINGTGLTLRLMTLADQNLIDGFTLEEGKGVFLNLVTATIKNCLIRNNSFYSSGGGLCAGSSNLTVTGCTIEHCEARDGGAAYLNNSGAVFENCRFVDNTAGGSGGGINLDDSTLHLTNCVIARNTAEEGGTGIWSSGSSLLSVTHCTIVDNTPLGYDGAIVSEGSLQMVNSIIWNVGQEIVSYGSGQVRYSCLQGGWNGEGNVNGLPGLLDWKAGNYHLGETSSCVDRGLLLPSASQDLDGNPRPGGDGLVDIGAFESEPANVPGSTTHTLTLIYVDSEISEPGDGSGWDSPLASIKDAFMLADTPEEIWVKAGTYHETVWCEPTAKLLGGFAGTETDPASRQWRMNPTVIDGSGLDSNSLTMPGECEVDGFTIMGGSSDEGGGVQILDGTGSLSNCVISGNTAENGGGIYIEYSAIPRIRNCVFRSNFAQRGGAIYVKGKPRIEDCTFENNSAQSQGGGVYFYMGQADVTSCVFTGNSSIVGGGGVCFFKTGGSLSQCLFSGNSSSVNGGGIAWYGSSAKISQCQLIGNWAENGGGLSCHSFHDIDWLRISRPIIYNCLLTENQAGSGYAIFAGAQSRPSLMNCSIAGNIPDSTAGAFAVEAKVVASVTNCIFWNGGYEFVGDSTPVVNYSDIEGGFPGVGNLNANPLFIDSVGHDYHLLPQSPCIGKGIGPSLDTEVPLVDIDEDPRSGNECDIGYDESTGPVWLREWRDY